MKILTRYVLRAHIGPFLFAFFTVTGLLFLNQVAQRMEEFVGKGLHWSLIAEFMVLTLPHIIALTFPMAVLVAVLYAFTELTSANEVSAMAAGGVNPARFMYPLLGVGLAISLLMVGFNDRVLSEANHRLSTLLTDVGSARPTFELREDVVNPVRTGNETRYFLRAAQIDQATNALTDVTIFDLSTFGRYRTIQASTGTMYFDENRSDLILVLRDGMVVEVADQNPRELQRLHFGEQIVRMAGVGSELERRASGGQRGEREMTLAMLEDRMRENLSRAEAVRQESIERSLEAVLSALAVAESPNALDDEPYPGLAPDDETELVRSSYDLTVNQVDVFRLAAYRYQVEYHKKWAIAFACIVFILLGPPLAIRFPRGGVGMVIAVSATIFFLYWAGLIGGERLADRGIVHPVVAMWAPNVILLIPALILVSGMGRQISPMRTGAWDHFRYRIKSLVLRPFGGPKEVEA